MAGRKAVKIVKIVEIKEPKSEQSMRQERIKYLWVHFNFLKIWKPFHLISDAQIL